jgi:hypothetical protein
VHLVSYFQAELVETNKNPFKQKQNEIVISSNRINNKSIKLTD